MILFYYKPEKEFYIVLSCVCEFVLLLPGKNFSEGIKLSCISDFVIHPENFSEGYCFVLRL